MTYIAMDIHQNHSTVAYLDPATGEIGSRKIKTSQAEITGLVQGFSGPAKITFEACRQAPAVCHWLEEEEVEIHLTNPEKMAAIIELSSAKTDASDAEAMLDAMMHGYLPESYLAPKPVREDRVLSRTRQGLVQIGTNLRNRLRIVSANATGLSRGGSRSPLQTGQTHHCWPSVWEWPFGHLFPLSVGFFVFFLFKRLKVGLPCLGVSADLFSGELAHGPAGAIHYTIVLG
ncbi:MAG: transposase [Pirellulaceae bacterium]